jgi:hypothetical protein
VATKRAEREAGQEGGSAAFVVGAILGGLAGAAWTLFNAPRSGAETRAELARAVERVVRGVGEAVTGARDRVRDAGERAADRVALALDSVAGGAGGPVDLLAVEPPAPADGLETASSPAATAPPAAATGDVVVHGSGVPDPATGEVRPFAADGAIAGDQTEPAADRPATATA